MRDRRDAPTATDSERSARRRRAVNNDGPYRTPSPPPERLECGCMRITLWALLLVMCVIALLLVALLLSVNL